MEKKKVTFTYKLLCILGFKYPVDDYGDVSMWRVIKQFFGNIYRRMLMNMMNWAILEPCNPRKFRSVLLRGMGAKVGKNVFIGDYVRVDLNHADLIEIEDGVHIAGGVRLLCHKKDLSAYSPGKVYGQQPYKYGRIHLCKNCAIGTGTVIMPGVKVGQGAVVGANALVTRDIPEWTLAIGSPAKVVREFQSITDKME